VRGGNEGSAANTAAPSDLVEYLSCVRNAASSCLSTGISATHLVVNSGATSCNELWIVRVPKGGHCCVAGRKPDLPRICKRRLLSLL